MESFRQKGYSMASWSTFIFRVFLKSDRSKILIYLFIYLFFPDVQHVENKPAEFIKGKYLALKSSASAAWMPQNLANFT